MSEPLWEPSAERIAAARLSAFIEQVNRDFGLDVAGYQALHDWSISEIGDFWRTVWDFGAVIAETRGEVAIADGGKMPGARFFPGARLNFAENLLRNASAVGRLDASGVGRRNVSDGTIPSGDALVFWGEDEVRRRLSHDELYDRVARLSRALVAMGVGPGDRVAAFLPNMPEAIIGMLAAASLGAIWSSCSPDFGVQGVIDRFGQIEPTVLMCADGYRFKGKWIDSLDRVARFLSQLPSVKHVIVAGYRGEPADVTALRNGPDGAARGDADDVDQAGVLSISALEDLYAEHTGDDIEFARMPFDHPLYILYSSGTTGKPKCIVHGAGGTLLKHIYEHQLMCEVRPGDRIFY